MGPLPAAHYSACSRSTATSSSKGRRLKRPMMPAILQRKRLHSSSSDSGDIPAVDSKKTRIRISDDILCDQNYNEIIEIRLPSAIEVTEQRSVSSASHTSSDDVFEIEKIIDQRYNDEKRCHEYLLKWLGYRRPSWEEEKNVYATDMLKEFKKSRRASEESIRAKSVSSLASSATMRQSLPIKRGPGRPPKNRLSLTPKTENKKIKRGPGRPPNPRPAQGPSETPALCEALASSSATSTPVKLLVTKPKPAPANSSHSKPPHPFSSQPKTTCGKTKVDNARAEPVVFKGTVITFDEGTADELDVMLLDDGEPNGFDKNVKVVRIWRTLTHNGRRCCVVRFVGQPLPQLIAEEEVIRHAPLEHAWHDRLWTSIRPVGEDPRLTAD